MIKKISTGILVLIGTLALLGFLAFLFIPGVMM